MKLFLSVVLAGLLMTGGAAASNYRDRSVEMRVMGSLDLNRYLGKWYEIARFPNRFERGCTAVTAEYALRSDGQISVRNTCRQGQPDGPIEVAEGSARVEGPGRLSVTFVPWLPFARGDYWVLYVDPDYRLAVVGEPKGNTGWILARQSEVSDTELATAIRVLQQNGYDTSRLARVVH